MKMQKFNNTKILAGLFGLMGLAWACEEEETTFAVPDTPAPSGVGIQISVKNDNTGSATLIPIGSGAALFQVIPDLTSAVDTFEVVPGKPITYTYNEGEYTAKVIGFGVDGKTTESDTTFSVIFSAPENLTTTIAVAERNVTLTPSADGATSFLIYWNNDLSQAPDTVQPGASGIHQYDSIATYAVLTVANGAGAATAQKIDSVTTVERIELPITFERDLSIRLFEGFGGANYAKIANPDQNGNASDNVGEVVKTANSEVWAGIVSTLSAPLDLSARNNIKVDVWFPKAGIPVILKLENAADDQVFIEKTVNTTTSNAWETLTFDFADVDVTIEYSKLVLFFDFGTAGDGSTYYFDNILQDFPPVTGGGGFETLSFEDEQFPLEGFEGATWEYAENPDKSGINETDSVIQYLKGDGSPFFAGGFFTMDQGIDFSGSKTVKFDAWSPKENITVRMKLEDSNNNTIFVETDATLTTANAWTELTYTFSDADPTANYDRVVIFFDFEVNKDADGSIYYIDNVQLPDGSGGSSGGGAITYSQNFEAGGIAFESFGGANAGIVENPEKTVNESDSVVQLFKSDGAEVWAGAFYELSTPLNFSAKTFSIDTYSPKTGATVRLKVENATDGDIFFEADATTTKSNEWETLTWDFSGIDASNDYHKIVIFFDFGTAGDGATYYYDNITLQ
jgi:hypothetical protein